MIKLHNISFVVIARNEEFALKQCLSSLAGLQCDNCEFIFVDSDSSDSTLQLMSDFSKSGENIDIRVVQIKGDINAAVARNQGCKEASKEFIFFVDGDTGVHPDFIERSLELFEKSQEILATQGQLEERIFDPSSHKEISFINDRFNQNEEREILHTGGNIFVRNTACVQVGGWNEGFMVNEDYEFSLKISRIGKIVGINKVMGTHFTFPFVSRSFSYFLKGFPKYTALIIKENFDRLDVVKMILKTQSGLFVGVFFYALLVLLICLQFVVNIKLGLGFIILFSFLIIDIVKGYFKKQNLLNRAMIRILFPLPLFYGLLFSIPKGYKRKHLSKKI